MKSLGVCSDLISFNEVTVCHHPSGKMKDFDIVFLVMKPSLAKCLAFSKDSKHYPQLAAGREWHGITPVIVYYAGNVTDHKENYWNIQYMLLGTVMWFLWGNILHLFFQHKTLLVLQMRAIVIFQSGEKLGKLYGFFILRAVKMWNRLSQELFLVSSIEYI